MQPVVAFAATVLFTVQAFAAAPVTSVESERRNQTPVSPVVVPPAGQSSAQVQVFPQPAQVQSLDLPTATNVTAELQMQVTALQEEVRQLRGQVEEQEFKLNQLLERQRELYRDIDRRLSSQSAAPVPAATVTTESELPPAATEPAKQPASTGSAPADAEQREYDAVFALVRNKQYAEAVQAYNEFLRKHPKGKLLPSARYWLGQVHYIQAQYEDAETQFKLVVTQHADSPRASDALLKLGEIEKRRGNNEQARALFQKLLQQYGDSSSAQVARQRLQELGR